MQTMAASSLVEVICAIHLGSYVEGFNQHRGGLMLVGPPGVMKSSFLDFLEPYPDAVILSDLNNEALMEMKGAMVTNAIRTLVIPEFQKLYERDPRTAANVEGSIRALTEEGFRGASFESSQVARFKARACVIGAMTDDTQLQHWQSWKNGFSRRFLWSLIKLHDPDLLMRAVDQWKRHGLDVLCPKSPAPHNIEMSLSVKERVGMRGFVKYQPKPANFSYELLCRVACVLRWHYKQTHQKDKDALKTVREFSLSLGKEGIDVTL